MGSYRARALINQLMDPQTRGLSLISAGEWRKNHFKKEMKLYFLFIFQIVNRSTRSDYYWAIIGQQPSTQGLKDHLQGVNRNGPRLLDPLNKILHP